MYKTQSARETKRLAGSIAKKFLKKRRRNKSALIFALCGELGSGKTTFAQGFIRALGIKKKVMSPTFILLRRFEIGPQAIYFKNVYHVDLYRLKDAKEIAQVGLKKILFNPQNIVLIEWADKIKRYLPKNVIWLKFFHGSTPNQRIIQYSRNA